MSNIQDIATDTLQFSIEEYQCLNKSILEQMAKLNEYANNLNKSIIKSCIQCGCLKIQTEKSCYESTYDKDITTNSTFINDNNCIGTPCKDCAEQFEKNIGGCLYYLASLCNTLDLNLYDIILKELDKINILRKYNIE